MAVQQLYDRDGNPVSVSKKQYFDIVVIGSGPAALTLVTRILEDRPAAIYLEDERRHLHWLKRQTHSAPTLQTRKPGKTSDRIIKGLDDKTKAAPRTSKLSILILDKLADGWLGQWHRNFSALEIPYLRSPMFFHPDPSDLDGLLEYAVQTNRAKSGPFTYLSDSMDGHASSGRRRSAKKAPVERPDLLEVPGVVGKEVSKHKFKQSRLRKHAQLVSNLGPIVNERDRRDYQNPSTPLFRDFTNQLVERYHIEPERTKDGCVRSLSDWLQDDESSRHSTATLLRAEVANLDYGRLQVTNFDDSAEDIEGFSIETSDGCCIGARYVISAVGYGGRPQIPPWLQNIARKTNHSTFAEADYHTSSGSDDNNSLSSHDSEDSAPSSHEEAHDKSTMEPKPCYDCYGEGWAHSAAICNPQFVFPNATLNARIKSRQPTTVIVIGGGLSSAQICDLCVRKGFTKVIFLLRGYFKVKPFDFSIDWVGKYANVNKMQFWQSDDATERMQMICDARTGGSINPPYSKILLHHAKTGVLEIKTHTEVESASWDPHTQKWTFTFHRKDCMDTETQFMNNKQEPGTSASCEADYLISSTGSSLGFSTLPFMHTLATKVVVPEVGGVPIVNEDLQYGPIPLYVIGSYSAIQIGPTAYNLGGIREGADRVAAKLRQMEEKESDSTEPPPPENAVSQYAHFSYHYLPVDSSE
ncbi:hypothetical protein MNAN1_003723 [Malassezia nana]|uniref:L-ornithine N(5)-monooxygenase n=1 Tax=Malassezia nana TaxID=180528 RepID=A0AAF0EMC6_9BASI|nr:hypothetical protein MNAN1_003723 [Malassezia nana]